MNDENVPLLEFIVKILRVNEETLCVDFMKADGDSLKFYKMFKQLKKLIFDEGNGEDEEDEKQNDLDQ